jgi:hypothetical protein
MTVQEPVTIGLSDSAKEKLRWLAEEKYFRQQVDAYRFAIGLALAQGVDPPEVHKSGTIFNIGSFDPDGALKRSIQAIIGDRLNGIAVDLPLKFHPVAIRASAVDTPFGAD